MSTKPYFDSFKLNLNIVMQKPKKIYRVGVKEKIGTKIMPGPKNFVKKCFSKQFALQNFRWGG